VELRGYHAAGLAVIDDRVEHDAEHDDADHHADPQDDHVQVEDGLTDRGDTHRHIHRTGSLASGLYIASGERQQRSSCRQSSRGLAERVANRPECLRATVYSLQTSCLQTMSRIGPVRNSLHHRVSVNPCRYSRVVLAMSF
jgi:ABC-type Zn2+ transport system substrate-binding protein/surface adhesin